ncbi:hypothetical protein HN51_039007 [Arachis hypogaea]
MFLYSFLERFLLTSNLLSVCNSFLFLHYSSVSVGREHILIRFVVQDIGMLLVSLEKSLMRVLLFSLSSTTCAIEEFGIETTKKKKKGYLFQGKKNTQMAQNSRELEN